MKRSFIAIIVMVLCSVPLKAQEINTQRIVENIADYILSNHEYGFVNWETGETYETTDELESVEKIDIKSPYAKWHYWNGVLNIAMLDLYEFTSNEKYKNYSLNNYEFAFDNVEFFESRYEDQSKWGYPFGQMIITEELDDVGAIGGGLIEVYQIDQQKRYRKYIEKAANHIMNDQYRLEDGTLARDFPEEMTLWADDLYMSVAFLSRMGDLTGEQKYFDDAVRQVKNFRKYLYNPNNGLYYHCWYSDNQKNGVAHWGRSNGWVMLAQVDLLNHLPKDHPGFNEVVTILEEQIIGASRHQSQSGLWHQLLDKKDSYLETSVSAMFTYCIGKAVNEGWIEDRYLSIAKRGWEGLVFKIQADGQVEDICIGTGISANILFYYNRPTKLNDIHGLGAVLLAGIEAMKFYN